MGGFGEVIENKRSLKLTGSWGDWWLYWRIRRDCERMENVSLAIYRL